MDIGFTDLYEISSPQSETAFRHCFNSVTVASRLHWISSLLAQASDTTLHLTVLSSASSHRFARLKWYLV